MSERSLKIAAGLGLTIALGGCNGYATCYHDECRYQAPAYAVVPPPPGPTLFDSPFNDYTQRSVTISSGAGNAQAANLALQTSGPWPRYSHDTNIPGNGAQTVRAVNEFETGTRETQNAKRALTPPPDLTVLSVGK